jgi:ABC-type antimicrobial peptide transport system permease subunit
MPVKDALFRIRARINLQVLKHTWLDIKRDKAKMVFGISGIAISLFILTGISILNSTQSYNYIKTVTITTGAADIVISRSIQSDITYDPFFEQTVINDDLQNIEGIEDFFSRIMMYVKTSSNKTKASGTLPLYGIEFKKEVENGRMGDLIIVDEDGLKTNEIYVGEPNIGECIILERAAELLNVSRGDYVHFSYQNYELSVKVVEICIQDQKFLEFETALIIVNMNEAQSFLSRENQINYIYGTIQNPELVYDASDISLTTRKLRDIGTRVQERLDINKYAVSMPKLEELEAGEFQVMGTTIIFWFITFLSMLITGILINSILSTSTEERVREFGILRVVGGKKAFPLKIVLLEGTFLGIVGSILGIILGLILTEPISRLVIGGQTFDYFRGAEIEFVIQPQSVITTFIIGVFVSLGVSLIPAIRTARVNLIKSITPFQTKEEGWEITKEGSMNVRSFLIGISISSIGMIMFIY